MCLVLCVPSVIAADGDASAALLATERRSIGGLIASSSATQKSAGVRPDWLSERRRNGALLHVSTAPTDVIQLGTRSGVFRDEWVLVGGSRCVVSDGGRLFHFRGEETPRRNKRASRSCFRLLGSPVRRPEHLACMRRAPVLREPFSSNRPLGAALPATYPRSGQLASRHGTPRH